MHPSTYLLPLLPLVASAQWATYLSNVLGKSSKVTISKAETINKSLVTLSGANWTSAASEPGRHVFLYFTDRDANPEDQRNATDVQERISAGFQESIYDLTVSKVSPSVSVSWINCKSESPSAELCPLFLAIHYPQLWHLTKTSNGVNSTLELRRIPLADLKGENVTSLANVIEQETWERHAQWNGPFNPISGVAKEYSEHLFEALKFWQLVPNWLIVAVISILGQKIASYFYLNPNARRGAVHAAPAAPVTAPVTETVKAPEVESVPVPSSPEPRPVRRSTRARTPAA